MPNISKADKVIKEKNELQKHHDERLMELYDTYFKKCIDGDTNSFRAFIDCSKELFKDDEQNELIKILGGAKIE